jgi:hypothetical protein
LANAFRAVWKREIPEENQNLPVATSTRPDLDKVYNNLMAIVSKGFENTMLEAGRYLIDTFYGGDPKVAHADKKKQSLNSLNHYIQELREKNPGAPGKSWIYNAVNLVIDHETIKKHSKKLFHTYGKIPLSHKVILFPVKDMAPKKRLIEYACKHQPTVVEFRIIRDTILLVKKRKTKLKEPVTDNIDKPKFLFCDESSEFLQVEYFNKLDLKDLEKLQTRTTDYIRGYQKLLKLLKDAISKKSKGHPFQSRQK